MRIVGPPGLRRMTDHLLAAWAEDTVVRVKGLERGRPGQPGGGYRDWRQLCARWPGSRVRGGGRTVGRGQPLAGPGAI